MMDSFLQLKVTPHEYEFLGTKDLKDKALKNWWHEVQLCCKTPIYKLSNMWTGVRPQKELQSHNMQHNWSFFFSPIFNL